jgi:signal transduction histidine kinase/CheY-like chemotaxis protein
MGFNLSHFLFVSYLINSLSCLVFAYWVYSSKTNSKVSRIFYSLSFFVFLYVFPYMLFTVETDKNMSLLFIQLATVGSIFLPVLTFHLITLTLSETNKYKIVINIGYALALIFGFLSFTPLMIKDVIPKFSMIYWPEPGVLYLYHLVPFFFFVIFLLVYLIKFYRNSEGHKKGQARYLLLSVFISYIGGSTNYFYWYDIDIPPFGGIFVSIYVGFFSYAIVAHRFMDIKLALKKSVVFMSAVLSTAMIILPVRLFFANTKEIPIFILDFIIIISAILVFPKIKSLFSKLANKYFFTSLYDSQELISSLNNLLRSTLDIDLLYKYIMETFMSAFHLKSFGVLEYSEETGQVKVKYNKNFDINGRQFFPIDKSLHEKYAQKNRVIVADDFRGKNYVKHKQMIDLMRSYEVEILIPLNTKNKTLGYLALGKKETNDNFNADDFKVLEIIAGLIATALDNARLYKEVKEKNVHLKDLLKMKGEFLRIVNHQLNTPVSIMRLGFSAMHEKTMPLKRSLEISEAGLERINSTLHAFWEAYELEGEKIEITPAEFDIVKTIERQVKEKLNLKNYRDKKIKINIKVPEGGVNKVIGDENKIIHVISNLLENALDYTKKGKINFNFKYIKQENSFFLKIIISDTGAGIPKNDIKIIFNKFTRGSKAVLIRPDGSGLGLYIAKRIIDAHRGTLSLEYTEEGKGSSFSFSLPASTNKLSINKKTGINDRYKIKTTEKKSVNKNRGNILFVDYEKSIIEVFRNSLKKNGYNLIDSIDLNEVINIAETMPIKAIIMDIVIPKIKKDGSVNMFAEQGYDFLKVLKNNNKTKSVPVIIYAGLNSVKDAEKAKSLGAYTYLFKGKAGFNSILKILNGIK